MLLPPLVRTIGVDTFRTHHRDDSNRKPKRRRPALLSVDDEEGLTSAEEVGGMKKIFAVGMFFLAISLVIGVTWVGPIARSQQ